MINFFLYSMPKGTPTTGVVELWKNIISQWKLMELGGLPQKMMMNIFIGDLYSMYVVLQGIGSLPCIMVFIIYVIPFEE